MSLFEQRKVNLSKIGDKQIDTSSLIDVPQQAAQYEKDGVLWRFGDYQNGLPQEVELLIYSELDGLSTMASW